MSDLNESPLVKLDRIQREAEARGYRRGVEDAAVRCDMELHNGRFPFDATRTDAHDRTAMAIRNDIRALLEQTGDSNSPHPGNGTGLKSET
jgi:hypothetical protein